MAKAMQQQIKPTSESRVGDATLSPRFAPAAPAPAQRAGVVAFITRDGLTVIRFSYWALILKRAQHLRQKGASPAEIAAYLTRKSRELDAQLGWLKRLWAARLQRVLKRLALQRGLAQRWDGKENELLLPEAACLFAALKMPVKECRSPPDFERPADAPLFVAFPFITPSVPRAERAPTFALPAWRGG